MLRERLGNVLPETNDEPTASGRPSAPRVAGPRPVGRAHDGVTAPDDEAVEFVRFCYRRRSVAWPELYDEMCAVAARGDFRGMGYEQLEGLGIRFALAALPRLADVAAQVIAEEREPHFIAIAPA